MRPRDSRADLAAATSTGAALPTDWTWVMENRGTGSLRIKNSLISSPVRCVPFSLPLGSSLAVAWCRRENANQNSWLFTTELAKLTKDRPPNLENAMSSTISPRQPPQLHPAYQPFGVSLFLFLIFPNGSPGRRAPKRLILSTTLFRSSRLAVGRVRPPNRSSIKASPVVRSRGRICISRRRSFLGQERREYTVQSVSAARTRLPHLPRQGLRRCHRRRSSYSAPGSTRGSPWETGFTFKTSPSSRPLKPRRDPMLPSPAPSGLEQPDRPARGTPTLRGTRSKPPPPLDDTAFVRRLHLDLIVPAAGAHRNRGLPERQGSGQTAAA